MIKDSSYRFKHSGDAGLFHCLRLELQIIFLDLCKLCDGGSLPRPIITSTIRAKMDWSKSTTHEDGRALDVRSTVYSLREKIMIVDYLNDKWSKKFGTAPKGKPPRVIIWEGKSKGGEHFHMQVRR